MSWAAHHAGYVLLVSMLVSGNAATQSIGMFSSCAAKGLLRVAMHLHWACVTAVLHVTSNSTHCLHTISQPHNLCLCFPALGDLCGPQRIGSNLEQRRLNAGRGAPSSSCHLGHVLPA
jgi:hypothetical protein